MNPRLALLLTPLLLAGCIIDKSDPWESCTFGCPGASCS
ncbi:MAG: hypothetical protein H6Q89_2921, partial [Myxococcaceae bacterium]|nr:hypothetical protein [Myxococcaceae bacterium]